MRREAKPAGIRSANKKALRVKGALVLQNIFLGDSRAVEEIQRLYNIAFYSK